MEKIDLSQYRVNVHSQFGEDKVMKKLFEITNTRNGYLVEFGAYDGVYLSNTRHHWEENQYFQVLQIEPNEERFFDLEKNYSGTDALLINSFVELEGENSLNTIFSRYNINNIALLVIDVDGPDLEIWNSLDTTVFRPRFVMIEQNVDLPKENFDALSYCFESVGYNLICCTGINFIFAEKSLGITSDQNVHQLRASSGLPDYDLLMDKVDKTEYDRLINIQYNSNDKEFFKKNAQPQNISYEL